MTAVVTHSKLDEVIAEMLVENTGVHFLDSGGSIGRAWQQNQAKAGDTPLEYFRSQPESVWHWPCVYPNPNFRAADIRDGYGRAELTPTHNVFQWLTGQALSDYHEGMDKAFYEFAADRPDDYWLAIMEDFPEHWANLCAVRAVFEEFPSPLWTEEFCNENDYDYLFGDHYVTPRGIYGDGDPFIHNTYNGEDCLSQTLQFLWFEHNDEAYVLLQIHGGADVRGGYTAPRAFSLGEHDDGIAILDNARASCGCDECDARWYTDSAGSCWQSDENIPSLDDMPAREGTKIEAAFLNAATGVLVGDELPWIVIEQRGEYACDDTLVWCPMCGTGTISPYFY